MKIKEQKIYSFVYLYLSIILILIIIYFSSCLATDYANTYQF